ncbi:MAG TPA: hypothetical protein VF988_09525, partial [Verrucomicrobiae bacterium]
AWEIGNNAMETPTVNRDVSESRCDAIRHPLVSDLLYRRIALLVACCFLGCGCIGPRYREHQLVLFGRHAPKITEPVVASVQAHLSAKPIPEAKWEGSFSGVVVSLFKGFGVQGWTDFHLQAEAHGRVLYHRTSSDGFTTVDLKLSSLRVNGMTVPLPAYRYIRAEIFRGWVALDRSLLMDQNTGIGIRGKLVWDNDGWFEIHPQKKDDVWPE